MLPRFRRRAVWSICLYVYHPQLYLAQAGKKPGGGGCFYCCLKKQWIYSDRVTAFPLSLGPRRFPATLGYVADCGGSIADAERKANDVGNKQAGATLNGVIKLFSSSGERLRNRPEHERSTSGRNDWKRKQVIGCKNQPMTCDNQWCPRRDSNARTRFRRAVLCPLSYGGADVIVALILARSYAAFVSEACSTYASCRGVGGFDVCTCWNVTFTVTFAPMLLIVYVPPEAATPSRPLTEATS